MFYFCLESVSVICVFLGILPFSLSYLIYGHTIIQNTLIILFISTVMSPLLFPILRLSSSPPPWSVWLKTCHLSAWSVQSHALWRLYHTGSALDRHFSISPAWLRTPESRLHIHPRLSHTLSKGLWTEWRMTQSWRSMGGMLRVMGFLRKDSRPELYSLSSNMGHFALVSQSARIWERNGQGTSHPGIRPGGRVFSRTKSCNRTYTTQRHWTPSLWLWGHCAQWIEITLISTQ